MNGQPHIRQKLWRTLQFLTVLILVLTAATVFAAEFWLADLLSHFRVYYFFILTLAAIALFLGGHRSLAFFALVAAAFHFSFLWPYYSSRSPALPGAGPVLKIASINVLTSNRNFQKVQDVITHENPDIIFLAETNQEWVSHLQPLLKTWPYAVTDARDPLDGTMVLSRIPLTSTRILNFDQSGRRSVEIHFIWDQKEITLFGIHPLRPVAKEWSRVHEAQMTEAIEAIQKIPGPVLVVGDFNATPWSYSFGQFIAETRLKDAALGFGIQNTWRSTLGMIRLPIDHICLSKDFEVKKFWLGQDIGSDHYPVFTDLVLIK